jgi:hypothetical protein
VSDVFEMLQAALADARRERDRLHINQIDLLRERDQLISQRDRAEGDRDRLRALLARLVEAWATPCADDDDWHNHVDAVYEDMRKEVQG